MHVLLEVVFSDAGVFAHHREFGLEIDDLIGLPDVFLVVFSGHVAGDFLHDVASAVGSGLERGHTVFMRADDFFAVFARFLPGILDYLRSVYRHTVSVSKDVFWRWRLRPSKHDSVVMRSLQASALRTVYDFVIWALRAVFTYYVVTKLLGADLPPETLKEVLDVLFD